MNTELLNYELSKSTGYNLSAENSGFLAGITSGNKAVMLLECRHSTEDPLVLGCQGRTWKLEIRAIFRKTIAAKERIDRKEFLFFCVSLRSLAAMIFFKMHQYSVRVNMLFCSGRWSVNV